MKNDDKECVEIREEKLDLINTLMPKVEETDFEDNCCIYVLARADDETKRVFIECGITEDVYNANIDDGLIDLNIIGFKYGIWFDSQEGYSSYERS